MLKRLPAARILFDQCCYNGHRFELVKKNDGYEKVRCTVCGHEFIHLIR